MKDPNTGPVPQAVVDQMLAWSAERVEADTLIVQVEGMIADEFLLRQVRGGVVAGVRRSFRQSLREGVTVPPAVHVKVPSALAVDEQRGVEIGATRFVL